ncbi:SGNH/GDSL hydrolase family protein [Candidatus Chloroploca asiatica]|uniref:SGNH hydrolase-type esterase domain-containing protein n=1 Tax=Candidatus Chloroploca asiatica TaxID=1506545 RepID=A0A2H3KK93_9CHLR|nr:GDSL-type esterase/lipase family protein [Candidatus Chloroploca asiatica]PDV98391.1 hypothetical protein A9Q02_15660 [Candidatus Chloroploca asiatica]
MQPSSLPQPSPVRRVVFFGDSRADWWLTPNLDGLRFLNAGVPGGSATYLARHFTRMVEPLHPDVIVLQLGVNDLAGGSPGLATQHAVFAAIATVTTEARRIAAPVVLTTIFPLARGPWASSQVQAAILAVNARLPTLVTDGVQLLDSAAVLCGPDGFVSSRYADDELHLSAAGYAMLNEALLRLIRG